MGRAKYLIDTNAAIDYIGEILPDKALNELDSIFDGKFYFSIINKIELLGFKNISADEEQNFYKLINASTIFNLTDDIVTKTIEVRKQHKIKLPDAIIAATALTNNLIIITRNTKDIEKIKGIKILNPYYL
ncbi:MAG: type II toxin-antitoxin system VapC family toxin [Prolixibacteraceae bacterium]|nr:type II toxin-antitoxin system VapC family toxin [Prolixibacteraceae bacterium]MBN2650444.1 type II toxin-antitoxin system VapC family toxin [Prolixibacteraceae bacterium]